MRNLFGGGEGAAASRGSGGNKFPRHSSGWKELQKHLKTQESLRVLDIGPTSSTNINYITSLGHSIYMANLVEEAVRPEWVIPGRVGKSRDMMLIAFSKQTSTFQAAIST